MSVYSMNSQKGLDHVQVAYVGKDNPIDLILQEDGQDYDYSTFKLVRCKIGQTEFDTASDPDAFDTSESSLGKLKIFIGAQSGIVAQAHNVKVEVTTDNDKTLYFGQVRVRVENPGI